MKTFALALGGGGARGLGAIATLEALDELGCKPTAIAGVSIGAVLGAAYAAGLTARAIRRLVTGIAHRRAETWARLVAARATALSQLFTAGFGNPLVLDAEKLATAFLPADLPEEFSALEIPLAVIAADLYGRREAIFTSGPLRRALAASMAVPGLLRPVELDGRILVDGAAVNPLPFEHLRGAADVVIAVDSTIGPTDRTGVPDPWECLFATLQVMGHTIVAEKLKRSAPDLLIRPNVGRFRLLDFFRASAILRAAEQKKAEIKEQIAAILA